MSTYLEGCQRLIFHGGGGVGGEGRGGLVRAQSEDFQIIKVLKP